MENTVRATSNACKTIYKQDPPRNCPADLFTPPLRRCDAVWTRNRVNYFTAEINTCVHVGWFISISKRTLNRKIRKQWSFYVAPFSFKNQLGEQRELKSVIISRAHGGFTAKENSFHNKVIRRDRMLRSSIFNEAWPHDDEGRAMW